MRILSGTMTRNRRGATLAIVAVSLFALLSMMALGIDLSMLYKARTDAQRAADAAALAGASAFLKEEGAKAIPIAEQRALELAQNNSMIGGPIESTEVTIRVIPDSEKVRVWVNRRAVNTWFARVFGVGAVPIGARAAAEATDAGAGKCVKPFAVPDLWDEKIEDPNHNHWPDGDHKQGGGGHKDDENWDYEPEEDGDHYRRWQNPEGTGDETGYGSDFRNNTETKGQSGDLVRYFGDQGRQLKVKMSSPHASPQPGFFYPWVLPGSQPGGKAYEENIKTCNPTPIHLEEDFDVDNEYLNKPGNMIGPTKKGMDDLIAQDPDAHWVEDAPDANGYTNGHIEGSDWADPMDSPRVILVPFMDPAYIGNGRTELRFNNLALMFIESMENQHAAVTARFIKFAKGTGPSGPNTGSLIKTLRLVE